MIVPTNPNRTSGARSSGVIVRMRHTVRFSPSGRQEASTPRGGARELPNPEGSDMPRKQRFKPSRKPKPPLPPVEDPIIEPTREPPIGADDTKRDEIAASTD